MKGYDINPTKTQGKMNDVTVNLYINHTRYFGKQYSFVCISEVTNNSCDWLNTVTYYEPGPEASQN